MEVGIRELKARLSAYLGDVAAGATIVITDRGKPVATLAPYSSTSLIDKGVDEGWIEPPRRTRLTPANPATSQQSVATVLDDDRGQ